MSSFQGGMASAVRTVGALDSEVTALNRSTVTGAKNIDNMGKSSQTSAKSMELLKVGAAAVGVAAVVGLVAAGKATVDFDKNMRNVTSLFTGSGESAAQAQQQYVSLSNTVLSLSKTLPQGPNDLAKGLYDIVSAGFSANDALTILKVSATAASAGLSTTADATQAITGVINAYGYSASQAGAISDVLFQTVNVGVVTFPQLAQGIGEVISVAAAAKVPIQDVGAAIATVTRAGIQPAQAFTGLTRTIQAIINPSAELTKTFTEMGYATGQQALQSLGLEGVIDKLRQTTNGSVTAIDSMFQDVRAQRTVFALMAQDGTLYASVMKQVADGNTAAGATERALAEQSKSVAFQFDIFRNTVEANAISIGQKLEPAAAKTLGTLTSLAQDGFDGAHTAAVTLAPQLDIIGGFISDIASDARVAVQDVGPLAGGLAAVGAKTTVDGLSGIAGGLGVVAKEAAQNRTVIDLLVIAYGAKLISQFVAARAASLQLALAFQADSLAASALEGQMPILASTSSFAAEKLAASGIATEGFATSLEGAAGLFNPVVLGLTALGGAFLLYENGQKKNKADIEAFTTDLEQEGAAATSAANQTITAALAHQTYQDVIRATGIDETTLTQAIEGSHAALTDVYNSLEQSDPVIQNNTRLRQLLSSALQGNQKDASEFAKELEAADPSYNGTQIANYVQQVSKLSTSYDQGSTAAKNAAAANDQFGSSGDNAVAALRDIATGAGAASENMASLSSIQKDVESSFSNYTSPKSVFQDLYQQAQTAQEQAASAATSATSKSTTAQKQAITDSTDTQIRALEEQKSAITNNTKGSTSEIQKQIDSLRNQESAEKSSLSTTQTAEAGKSAAVKGSTDQVTVSLQDYINGLNKSSDDMEAWEKNLAKVAGKAGPDVANELAKLGPDAAPLVQQFADASDATSKQAADAIRRNIGEGLAGVADDQALDWQIVATKASLGAGATADAIAKTLGQKVEDIQRVAAEYGVSLENAINPVLAAAGFKQVSAVNGVNNGTNFPYGNTAPIVKHAQGGIESHVAQIASGGPVRVWAEPETGGEAYIPLHPAKRSRSIGIWQRTGELLGLSGGSNRAFASGGFSGVPGVPPLPDYLVAQAATAMMNDGYQAALSILAGINGAGTTGAAPAGQITDWIHQAEKIANWPDAYTNGIYAIIMHESGGNPKAINLTDSNAAAGHPSKGLMQTIDSTFSAHAFPGHTNIFDPIDNILAGTSYALSRYGVGMVEAGGRHDSKGNYIGYAGGGFYRGTYDQGGALLPGTTIAYNGTGKPEHVMTEVQIDRIVSAINKQKPQLVSQTIVETTSPVETARQARRALA